LAKQRFTGPQIKRFRRRNPDVYEDTARISLVSSFLCSLFLGRIAPLDISDVCGMNLWDIQKDSWDQNLLATAAEGGKGGVEALAKKLGDVERIHGKNLGRVSPWFVERYGFSPGVVSVW
jgi:xylulokinase